MFYNHTIVMLQIFNISLHQPSLTCGKLTNLDNSNFTEIQVNFLLFFLLLHVYIFGLIQFLHLLLRMYCLIQRMYSMTLTMVKYWCILVYSFLKDSFQNVLYNLIREYITYNNLYYKIVKYIPHYNKELRTKLPSA